MASRPSAPFDRRWGLVLCIAIALAALLINPIGYVGGHNDDWRYLQAARCWLSNNDPCIPTNHWATRWPTLAALAGAIRILGESRTSVGLAMLPWWIAAIALAGWLGRLWIDRTAGLVAAAVLAATPVVTQSALQPNADLVELAMQLAALVAATIAYRGQSRGAALTAGLFAALAVQSRDTSLLPCAAAALAWLTLKRGPRRILWWTLAGFAAAVAAEQIIYAVATGDPLFRYRLALAHGTIPTDELPVNFDLEQSPLLNPAYIANWRREMGLHWWWPLDPWLNLIASPRIGFSLIGAALLGIVHWRMLTPAIRGRLRAAGVLTMLVVMLLIYGLAIDPKPRMMMMLAAFSSLVIGASLSAAIRTRRAMVPGAVVILMIGLGLLTLARISNTHTFEALAGRWIAEHQEAISIDPNSRSTLALVAGTSTLPSTPSVNGWRIMGGNEPCSAYDGRTIDRSPVTGGGQLCLQDLRPLTARTNPR